MVIVRDVVKIDEPSNHIILKALFRLHPSTKTQRFLLVRSKMLDQQISIDWLIVNARTI
jgi:hypothetical protein